MNTQPEALRLADWIESDEPPTNEATCAHVAAELRRLHEENQKQSIDWNVLRDRYDALMADRNRLHEVNQELVEALEMMTDRFLDTEGKYGSYEQEAMDLAYAALAKARGTE